jgi:hypothetical protein
MESHGEPKAYRPKQYNAENSTILPPPECMLQGDGGKHTHSRLGIGKAEPVSKYRCSRGGAGKSRGKSFMKVQR